MSPDILEFKAYISLTQATTSVYIYQLTDEVVYVSQRTEDVAYISLTREADVQL